MPEALVAEAPEKEVILTTPNRPSVPAEQKPKDDSAEVATSGQKQEEQAPSASPEGEQPATEKDEPEKRGQRRFERRIQRVYQKMAEEKARADFLQKQLEEAKPKPTVDPTAPTLEQFGFDPEKYAEAKATHEKNKALKEFEATQRQAREKALIDSVTTSWEEKQARGEDKYEDFEAKVGKLDPRNPVVLSIMESDIGDEIAYYLGSHTKEAEKIFQLSPASAIREIGKLEAKILSTPEKPKTPSKAPAPIQPLTGTTPVVGTEPSEADDMKTWMKKREKQLAARRR